MVVWYTLVMGWPKGVKKSEDFKKRVSATLLGRKRGVMPQWHRDKISKTRIRLNIEPGNKGKKYPQFSGVNNPAFRPEVRAKIAMSKMGDKNPNWRGGVSTENAKLRASSKFREWRIKVFTRDNYTCIFCGRRNGNGENVVLHADHIKQFAFYPELRFEISNGRTLCRECHRETDTYKINKKI